VFTQSGYYVGTSYTETDVNNGSALSLTSGSTTGNLWNITYEVPTEDMAGYALSKQDNRYDDTDSDLKEQSEYLYWNDYNGTKIGLYDMDEGSTFVFTSSDTRHYNALKEQGVTFDGSTPISSTTFGAAFDSIRIATKQIVYDSWQKGYLASIPQSTLEVENWKTTLTYKLSLTMQVTRSRLTDKRPMPRQVK